MVILDSFRHMAGASELFSRRQSILNQMQTWRWWRWDRRATTSWRGCSRAQPKMPTRARWLRRLRLVEWKLVILWGYVLRSITCVFNICLYFLFSRRMCHDQARRSRGIRRRQWRRWPRRAEEARNWPILVCSKFNGARVASSPIASDVRCCCFVYVSLKKKWKVYWNIICCNCLGTSCPQ